MTHDLTDLMRRAAPTARRPLLGLTLLVVEDSRAASEAVRLMALRSGARVRRAASLQAARRHLRTYRPTAVIIDLGLPDGTGADLIAELAAARTRVDAILATSGDPAAQHLAAAAGADAFLAKPVDSVAAFQEAVLAALPAHVQPAGPRAVTPDALPLDRVAFHEDVARAGELLDGARGDAQLAYLAQFLGSVARDAKDAELAAAADDLGRQIAGGAPSDRGKARLHAVISARLEAAAAV